MNWLLEELAKFDLEELRQYSHEKRVEIVTQAIEDMAKTGIITSQERKEMLRDLNKWLLENLGDA